MNQLLAMRVFIRIAEAGTFVKAADSLDIPKPTVTKLIQTLETHLGVKLLRRTTRRVAVTPEGALYHEHATRLITELEEMDRLVGGARAQPKGLLRVDIGSSLANIVLIPLLADFRQRYPDIRLHVGVSDRAVDLISDGVDCVIRGGVLVDSSLVARRIADLKYVTCASTSYLKAYGMPSHPKELEQGHRLVGYFSSLTSRPFPLSFEKGARESYHRYRYCVLGERKHGALDGTPAGSWSRADVRVHGPTALKARLARGFTRQLVATVATDSIGLSGKPAFDAKLRVFWIGRRGLCDIWCWPAIRGLAKPTTKETGRSRSSPVN